MASPVTRPRSKFDNGRFGVSGLHMSRFDRQGTPVPRSTHLYQTSGSTPGYSEYPNLHTFVGYGIHGKHSVYNTGQSRLSPRDRGDREFLIPRAPGAPRALRAHRTTLRFSGHLLGLCARLCVMCFKTLLDIPYLPKELSHMSPVKCKRPDSDTRLARYISSLGTPRTVL